LFSKEIATHKGGVRDRIERGEVFKGKGLGWGKTAVGGGALEAAQPKEWVKHEWAWEDRKVKREKKDKSTESHVE